MSCFKRLQRLLSGVIVVTFFVTNTLTPAPTVYAKGVEYTANFFAENAFKIPAEFGKVTATIQSSSEAPLLIHIEEAHANYDAQTNIKHILEHLANNYGLDLVFLEGAGDKLQPELFSFFPNNKKLNAAVTDNLLKAGELTGAEAFLINTGTRDARQETRTAKRRNRAPAGVARGPEGFGIENAAAYAENRAAYKKVYQGRKIAENFLTAFYLRWQKTADGRLNKSLREFLDRDLAYEEERLPLQGWLAFLKQKALGHLKIDLEGVQEQLDWPVLVRYFRLQKIGSEIDEAKALKEQEVFLSDLKTRKVPESLLGEITKLLGYKAASDLPLYKTRFVFEKLMDYLPENYSFELYPVFRLRLQQLILLSELQGERLREEVKTLAQKMIVSLTQTESEKNLVNILRQYRLLKKLFKLELRRSEYLEIRSQRITPGTLITGLGLKPAKLSAVTALFETATDFYNGAIVREDHMMQNAMKLLAEQKNNKAVLITGGFHTEGLKEKIAAAGNSYIGITPAIGEIAPDNNKNYLTALLGSDVLSKSQIAPEVISQPSFFRAVSPRFWRRELSVRLVRVRDIVRQTVASFGGSVTENKKEFDGNFQRYIDATVSASTDEQSIKVIPPSSPTTATFFSATPQSQSPKPKSSFVRALPSLPDLMQFHPALIATKALTRHSKGRSELRRFRLVVLAGMVALTSLLSAVTAKAQTFFPGKPKLITYGVGGSGSITQYNSSRFLWNYSVMSDAWGSWTSATMNFLSGEGTQNLSAFNEFQFNFRGYNDHTGGQAVFTVEFQDAEGDTAKKFIAGIYDDQLQTVTIPKASLEIQPGTTVNWDRIKAVAFVVTNGSMMPRNFSGWLEIETGGLYFTADVAPTSGLTPSDTIQLPNGTIGAPQPTVVFAPGASVTATGTENGIQITYNNGTQDWSGGGFNYDNFGTPQIETGDLSGLSSLVFAVRGNPSQVKMEIVDGQDRKEFVYLTQVTPTSQVWSVSTDLFAGVDLSHVRIIYFIIEGQGASGSLYVDHIPVTPDIIEIGSVTNGASVTFQSFAGSSYKIQYKNNLGDSLWHDAETVVATGTQTTWVDNGSKTGGLSRARFYRVVYVRSEARDQAQGSPLFLPRFFSAEELAAAGELSVYKFLRANGLDNDGLKNRTLQFVLSDGRNFDLLTGLNPEVAIDVSLTGHHLVQKASQLRALEIRGAEDFGRAGGSERIKSRVAVSDAKDKAPEKFLAAQPLSASHPVFAVHGEMRQKTKPLSLTDFVNPGRTFQRIMRNGIGAADELLGTARTQAIHDQTYLYLLDPVFREVMLRTEGGLGEREKFILLHGNRFEPDNYMSHEEIAGALLEQGFMTDLITDERVRQLEARILEKVRRVYEAFLLAEAGPAALLEMPRLWVLRASPIKNPAKIVAVPGPLATSSGSVARSETRGRSPEDIAWIQKVLVIDDPKRAQALKAMVEKICPRAQVMMTAPGDSGEILGTAGRFDLVIAAFEMLSFKDQEKWTVWKKQNQRTALVFWTTSRAERLLKAVAELSQKQIIAGVFERPLSARIGPQGTYYELTQNHEEQLLNILSQWKKHYYSAEELAAGGEASVLEFLKAKGYSPEELRYKVLKLSARGQAYELPLEEGSEWLDVTLKTIDVNFVSQLESLEILDADSALVRSEIRSVFNPFQRMAMAGFFVSWHMLFSTKAAAQTVLPGKPRLRTEGGKISLTQTDDASFRADFHLKKKSENAAVVIDFMAGEGAQDLTGFGKIDFLIQGAIENPEKNNAELSIIVSDSEGDEVSQTVGELPPTNQLITVFLSSLEDANPDLDLESIAAIRLHVSAANGKNQNVKGYFQVESGGLYFVSVNPPGVPAPNIVSFRVTPAGNVIEFESVPDALYYMQRTENLVEPAWQEIGQTHGASGQTVTTFIDTTSESLTQSFYRVVSPHANSSLNLSEGDPADLSKTDSRSETREVIVWRVNARKTGVAIGGKNIFAENRVQLISGLKSFGITAAPKGEREIVINQEAFRWNDVVTLENELKAFLATRSEARENMSDIRDVRTWTDVFAAIRWISEQKDIEKHIGLIRQISLRLRERKKAMTLNRTRDYDQYPEDIAEDALASAAQLLSRTQKEFRRPIKELVVATPYFFDNSSLNLHSALWSFAADLDERLLRTKFARDLREIVHGASFSYNTLFMVRAYLSYLDTGDSELLRQQRIFLEEGDQELRKELMAMKPEDRETHDIYKDLKDMEKALVILFEGTFREDVFKDWMRQNFVKSTPDLAQALQEILDAPDGEPFFRTQKIIAARELIMELEDRAANSVFLYHLYHLDRSLGQLMSVSLADFFDQWDADGDRAMLQAIDLMRRLITELLRSGFITRYTAQWIDLLGDRTLTFDQLKDVLSVVEREIRRELAVWNADYYSAAAALYENDYEKIDNITAMIRKEKFATMAAFKLLEKLKQKVEQKKGREARVYLNPEAAENLMREKQSDPFRDILHIDDFKTPNYVSKPYERKTYGGKASYLMRMNALGLPVPSAFVIPSYVGKYGWQEKHRDAFRNALRQHLEKLEKDWFVKTGKDTRYGRVPSEMFKEKFEPMLLSVRSGAVFVMPGIFETAICVGFTPEVLEHLINKRGLRAAYSAYLGFMESTGVSLGIARGEFEEITHAFMKERHKDRWEELSGNDLVALAELFNQLFNREGVTDQFKALYQNPEKQLELFIDQVFESWNSPKARRYRREKNISDEWYTPVVVQAYVFGDREASGAGIAFSRDRQTNEKVLGGEWIPSGHGMMLMQGRLEPEQLESLSKKYPASYKILGDSTRALDEYFGVPQMIEFTIEEGKPWILQTVYDRRVGHEEAFPEIDWKKAEHPKQLGKGSVAFGDSGALRGFVVFDKMDAIRSDVLERLKNDPELDAVIFASLFPTPEDSADVINMHKVLGAIGKRLILLTARGGQTSHAAVVANYESIPTVVSVNGLEIDKTGVIMSGQALDEHDIVTVDFGTGIVYAGGQPLISQSSSSPRSEALEKKSELKPAQILVECDNPKPGILHVRVSIPKNSASSEISLNVMGGAFEVAQELGKLTLGFGILPSAKTEGAQLTLSEFVGNDLVQVRTVDFFDPQASTVLGETLYELIVRRVNQKIAIDRANDESRQRNPGARVVATRPAAAGEPRRSELRSRREAQTKVFSSLRINNPYIFQNAFSRLGIQAFATYSGEDELDLTRVAVEFAAFGTTGAATVWAGSEKFWDILKQQGVRVSAGKGDALKFSRGFAKSETFHTVPSGRSELRKIPATHLREWFNRQSDKAISLNVGHDRVRARALQLGDEDFLLMLEHTGAPFAADVNFIPDRVFAPSGGVFSRDPEALFEFFKVYDSDDESINPIHPGDPMILTNDAMQYLGLGPRDPLPPGKTKIYHLRKMIQRSLKNDRDTYREVLKDSLQWYRRYGLRERFQHSFISQEMIRALNGGYREFKVFFHELSEIIRSPRTRLDLGNLAMVFRDLMDQKPELKNRTHKFLISMAVEDQKSDPRASSDAVNILQSSAVGEVAIVSPETLWTEGTGGLAKAVTELALTLAHLGLDITLVAPIYAYNKGEVIERFGFKDTGRAVVVAYDNSGYIENVPLHIFKTKIKNVRVLGLVSDRAFPKLKGKDWEQSGYNGTNSFKLRFARALSLGALLAVREMNIHPSIVQTNDWPTAYVKAYLEGRERILPELQKLKQDPHFRRTRVSSVFHNLHKDYQGWAYITRDWKAKQLTDDETRRRDAMIYHDLGMKVAEDWEVLFAPGLPGIINPTFTALKTSDLALTVGEGYHERSLDPRYWEEFGGLTGELQYKNGLGHYRGVPNGIEIIAQQRRFLEQWLLKPEVLARMRADLKSPEWDPGMEGFREYLGQVSEQPEKFIKSFMEIGHEQERRLLAKVVLDYLQPAAKKALVAATGLTGDPAQIFIDSMLHRIDMQKGHHLLLAEVWRLGDSDGLRLNPFHPPFRMSKDINQQAVPMRDLFDDPEERIQLTKSQAARLRDFAREKGVEVLKALDVMLALHPDVRFVVAGSVEEGSSYEKGFLESAALFPGRLFFKPVFVRPHETMYDLIYGGSDLFDMPSLFEPGGISNKEAAGNGVVRHLRNVDGLADTLITRGELTEGFKKFNPVHWISSLMKMYAVYREDPGTWREAQYELLTQDARWIEVTRNKYLPGWLRTLGKQLMPEIRALEVASAIHRARGQKDPANELIAAGYTSEKAADYVVEALVRSENEMLVRVLLTQHIGSLAKIDQATRTYLKRKLEENQAKVMPPKVLIRLEGALTVLESLESASPRSEARSRRDVAKLMEEQIAELKRVFPKISQVWGIASKTAAVQSAFEKINLADDVPSLVTAFKEASTVLKSTLKTKRSSILLFALRFTKSELWVYPAAGLFFAPLTVVAPGEIKWISGAISFWLFFYEAASVYMRWFLGERQPGMNLGRRMTLNEQVDSYGRVVLRAFDKLMMQTVIRAERDASDARATTAPRSELRKINGKAGEEEVRARLQELTKSRDAEVKRRAKQYLSQELVSGGRKGSANLSRAKEFINDVSGSRSEMRGEKVGFTEGWEQVISAKMIPPGSRPVFQRERELVVRSNSGVTAFLGAPTVSPSNRFLVIENHSDELREGVVDVDLQSFPEIRNAYLKRQPQFESATIQDAFGDFWLWDPFANDGRGGGQEFYVGQNVRVEHIQGTGAQIYFKLQPGQHHSWALQSAEVLDHFHGAWKIQDQKYNEKTDETLVMRPLAPHKSFEDEVTFIIFEKISKSSYSPSQLYRATIKGDSSGRIYVIKRFSDEGKQEQEEESIGILMSALRNQNEPRNFVNEILERHGIQARAYNPLLFKGIRAFQTSTGKEIPLWAYSESLAIVYPYIEGVDWGHHLQEIRFLPENEYLLHVLNIMTRASKTAAILESEGVPHWDYHPGNFILTPNEFLALLDYQKMDPRRNSAPAMLVAMFMYALKLKGIITQTEREKPTFHFETNNRLVPAQEIIRDIILGNYQQPSDSVGDLAAKFGSSHAVLAREMGALRSRSEIRTVAEKKWAAIKTPRAANQHLYSRQFEAGYPMHVLKKVEELYDAYQAGQISQTTLTGGLGALLPDLFEAWPAIGLNVTGIHPLWNFIKNKPIKGTNVQGQRILFGEIVKKAMELTPIEIKVQTIKRGAPTTVFFRVYKTYYQEHRSPQYYLDGYTKTAEGKEEPFFDEVYDDTGIREIHMAAFQEASERLIQTLEGNPDPADVVILDHEVFVSLPQVFLKKAKRVTLNHTVFRPGLFEAWEGHYGLFKFPEWLRSVIVHDGKISIADFTAEIYDLISGVNLVEHLPALLKNIFRVAWHRVKGFYDPKQQIRSTNGVFLPRWQAKARRTLIEQYKRQMAFQPPEYGLPPASNDREFFLELDKHPDLRERFKAQNEWVMASDAARFLTWLREKRGFKGARDWLGNSLKEYQQEQGWDDATLMSRLKDMQELIQKAAFENQPGDWNALETGFSKMRDIILADPVVSNIRRQVAYKGPDKYEEIEVEEILGKILPAAAEAARQAGISSDRSGRFNRPFDSLFQFWKSYRKGENQDHGRFQREFETVRVRLKDQDAVQEVRESICRVLIGGRTFDEENAYERYLYIGFMSELLGLEDRIATLDDYTYYEAEIIFQGVQGSVMLSDKDLEASATSMMKVMANGGEVIGPFAGSNPEIWVIHDAKSGKSIEVLNEKGEPAFDYKTLREKLRSGEWQLLNGVYVDYNESEKSTQEGGEWRPSARSLLEALKTVRTLRKDPATRRERMYQSVSNAWRVDMVVGQAMGHALMIENMLKEDAEREAMFSKLKFEASDYAVPVQAPDFEWQGISGRRKHSAPGMGFFGMFRSFRDLKTWQNKVPKKQPDGSISEDYDASTRGIEAQNSIKHHAYYGDLFRYFKENILARFSKGLDPFKEQIEDLAARAMVANEKERITLNLQAMELMEMLLVRMAGDWFERYMRAANPAEARVLAEQLVQSVKINYQPWAGYIARYLDHHSNARSLGTQDHSILSYLFKMRDGQSFLVNLNIDAPVKHEEKQEFQGYKARTQVSIDAGAFSDLVGGDTEAQEVRISEPKLGKVYKIHPKSELMFEIGIGIPMPLGIEVLKWTPMRLPEIVRIIDRISDRDMTAMASLKQLIRQAGADYQRAEGEVTTNHFFEQLDDLSYYDQKNAQSLFKDNMRPLLAIMGLFRPDLLGSSRIPSWGSPRFLGDLNKAVAALKQLFGDQFFDPNGHHYYVFDASHQGSLVLARKIPMSGDVFFASIILGTDKSEYASDGKVATRIQNGLERFIESGVRYQVTNLVTKEDYGLREDLLQGWTHKVRAAPNGPRVQFLLLKKQTSHTRSEARETSRVRSESRVTVTAQDQVRTVDPKEWFFDQDIDRTLTSLAQVVRQSFVDHRPVRLTAVSISPDQDSLLAMLGFAAQNSRQDQERALLVALPGRLMADKGASFARLGRNVMLSFSNGEQVALFLANGKYSNTFENLIKNALQGSERQRGIESFGTEIQKGGIRFKEPAPLEYVLVDKATLARELGLEAGGVADAVVTQAEYARLPVTISETKDRTSPRPVVSAQAVSLSKVLSDIQEAWNERKSHWGVQRVEQKQSALMVYDDLIRDNNRKWQEILQRAEAQAVTEAQMLYQALYQKSIPESEMEKARQDVRKDFGGFLPKETPYSQIPKSEAAIEAFLQTPVDSSDTDALKTRIEKLFREFVKLQNLIRDRTLAMIELTVAGEHPETQDFLIKDIVQLHFLQKVSAVILNGHDKELANFLMKLLGKQPGITLVKKLNQKPASAASADRGQILTTLSELKDLLAQRKTFYDARSPLLAETIGRIYGDVIEQFTRLSDIQEDQDFTRTLRSILDMLVTVWSSDERGYWFTGMSEKPEMDRVTADKYGKLMEKVMVPLFMDTPVEVRSFVSGKKSSSSQALQVLRSELRKESGAVLSPPADSPAPSLLDDQPLTLEAPPLTISAHELFIRENIKRGGGSKQGVRAVADGIMDGIIPLLAHTLSAAELLLPAITKIPEAQKIHAAAARRVLGLAPDIGYAFILGSDLALRKGMIEMAKSILKDSAFAILVKNDAAMVARAEALIRQEGLQDRVFVVTDVKLARSRIAKPGAALRGLISSDELMLAEELKVELKDDLIVMDKGMQQRFLNAAGQLFQSLADKIAAQFSLARSA